MAQAPSLPRWGERGWYLLALVQPFLLLWWLVPGITGWTIGNDYQVYAIEYQLELLYSVFSGSYPLYVPGFHHGQSAAALSLGGLHHPIAWICGMMPGYWQGHALSWNTLFRLVTLGLAHLALWRLLRAFGLPLWLGWLLSTLAVYNLRMLDMFRFAATLEAWTGTWFVVAAAGWLWLDRRSRVAPFALVVATWWLVCSGHPQFAYFGAMAAGLAILALPSLGRAGLGAPADPWPTAWAFYLRSALWVGLGVCLSASLLLPFVFDFMAGNSGRVGREYTWTLSYSDTPAGILASFVLPLRADVHGAIGGTSLLLVALLLPFGRVLGLRIARSAWLWLALVFVVLLYTLGGYTPLHHWAWELVPFAKAFRVPGRLAQLLPMLLLLLSLLGWQAWRGAGEDTAGARRGFGLAVALALILQVAAPWIWSALNPRHTMVNPQQLQAIPWSYELGVAGLGLGALLFLLALVIRPRWRWLAVPLCVLVLAQLGMSLARGTWIEHAQATPSWQDMGERKQAELKFYYGLHGQGESMEQAVVREHDKHDAPFRRELARLCNSPRAALDRDHAYELLLADIPGPGACVIEGLDQDREQELGGRIELEHASFNRQVFEVSSTADTWLVVHHPFDGHWQGWVDGHEVEIRRADGLELALPVPAGDRSVEIRYGSQAWTAGAAISSAALLLLGVLASLRLLVGRRRWAGVSVAVLVAVGLFGLWRASLYSGDHLGTEYSWQDGVARYPPLRGELVPPGQLCRSLEGQQIPCRY